MKISKNTVIILITFLVGACLSTVGCSSTAKKPVQPIRSTPAAPQTSQNASPAPTSSKAPLPNPDSPLEITNQAVAEANKVIGHNKAAAFVTDKVIYIGLDLGSDIDKQDSYRIEKNVIDRVKRLESGGYTVRVTSDINIVSQIKIVYQGIAQGKPMLDYNIEVDRVTRELTPKGS